MTANEKRLFSIFLICAAGAVILPFGFLGKERLEKAEKSIDSYVAAISKIKRYDQDMEAVKERIVTLKSILGDAELPRRSQSLSAFAGEARTLLARHGIEPLRYQVVGVGDDVSVEFTLRCDSYSLMRFLRDASQKERSWTMPLVAIHPDKTGPNVNATIRIRYAQ